MAISFFCVLVLGLYIYHEWSYDKFHSNKDSIYRLWEESGDRPFAVTPYAWREPMLQEFPEIKDITQIQTVSSIFKVENQLYSEANGIAVDTSFFNIFSFNVYNGSQERLAQPDQILITDRIATKYFGELDPVGRTILINLFGESHPFSVAGLIDCPDNSHLQFDYVLPIEGVKSHNPNTQAYENWSVHFLYTYLLIPENPDFDKIKEEFNAFLHRHHGEWLSAKYQPQIEPLQEIYLTSNKAFDFQTKGSLRNLRILGSVALAIFIIGGINFINLTTARAFTKAKSSSIRKVYGSSKRQLVYQFLVEAGILLFVALIVSFLLLQILTEPLSQLLGKDFSLKAWISPSFILGIGLFWMLASFSIGLYPGLLVSSSRPIELLRAKNIRSRKQLVARKILAIFQISCAAILIVCTIVMWQQVNFMGNKNLGYEKDQVLVINDGGLVAADPLKFNAFKNQLINRSYFEEMCALSSYPGTSSHWSSRYFLEGDDESSSMSITTFFSDHNFVKTMGLKIKEGRDFDLARPIDSINFIVNQACLDLFAQKDERWASDPFSQTLDWRFNKQKGKVVGIVEDFHFESLKDEIRPVIIMEYLPFASFIGLKINSTDYESVVKEIEELWVSMHPNIPFSYAFANSTFDKTFQAELKLGKLFILFASLTIFISMLGLLGLAASLAHEKSREISIRKVVGASRKNILSLLIYQFSINHSDCKYFCYSRCIFSFQ